MILTADARGLTQMVIGIYLRLFAFICGQKVGDLSIGNVGPIPSPRLTKVPNQKSAIASSGTDKIEIDLLRSYQPMLVFDNDIEASYRFLVSRGNQRLLADLYLFNLPDMIPQY